MVLKETINKHYTFGSHISLRFAFFSLSFGMNINKKKKVCVNQRKHIHKAFHHSRYRIFLCFLSTQHFSTLCDLFCFNFFTNIFSVLIVSASQNETKQKNWKTRWKINKRISQKWIIDVIFVYCYCACTQSEQEFGGILLNENWAVNRQQQRWRKRNVLLVRMVMATKINLCLVPKRMNFSASCFGIVKNALTLRICCCPFPIYKSNSEITTIESFGLRCMCGILSEAMYYALS